MRVFKFVALVLISFIIHLLIISSTFAAEVPKIKDSEITRAVEDELLADEEVFSHLIDVTTNDGIVILSGSVENLLAKERAVEIAQSIKGVRSVINEIEVEAVSRSDSEIRRDVISALRLNPATESFEIDVSVDNGIVTLTGAVESYAERNICAEVVKGVKDVRDIRNNISVNYKTERPDNEIENEIEKRLKFDVRVDDGLITVQVEDGKVTLKGTVGSAAESEQAESDAWVAGVKSVNNQLKVEWWNREEMHRKEFEPSAQEIKKAVEDAFLYDPRVWEFPVEVEVSNGVVTLAGTVSNLQAKRAAENDAENTVGVWRVKNHIRVRPDIAPSDRELAQEVRQALSENPYTERYEIDVSVRNSKVFLAGEIDSFFEKNKAEDVASRVKGVVEIKNNLTVPEVTVQKDDWEIKEDIESELFWSPFVDSDEVTVTVENGVAELEGVVDNWSEFNAAMENALEGGAKEVVNHLKVRHGPEYYQPR